MQGAVFRLVYDQEPVRGASQIFGSPVQDYFETAVKRGIVEGLGRREEGRLNFDSKDRFEKVWCRTAAGAQPLANWLEHLIANAKFANTVIAQVSIPVSSSQGNLRGGRRY